MDLPPPVCKRGCQPRWTAGGPSLLRLVSAMDLTRCPAGHSSALVMVGGWGTEDRGQAARVELQGVTEWAG